MSASPVVPLRPASKAQGLLRIAEGLRTIAQGCEELASSPSPADFSTSEDVTLAEAERVTGLDRRTLLRQTRGKPFRRNYSRTRICFERVGFERWRKGASR